MEKKTVAKKKITSKQVNTPNGGRGGARAGSGRPKGTTDQLTIVGLLEAVKAKSKGQSYEQILVEDFLQSRDNGDTHLTVKYHNLILNKVMGTLNKVEVTDSKDQLEMKQQAFSEALAKLTGIKKD
jgi:hypothetical protein